MKGVSDIESIRLSRLLTSAIVAVVVVLFLSHSFSTYSIKPMTYDGTLVRAGGYSFVFEAWDTVVKKMKVCAGVVKSIISSPSTLLSH